MDSTRSASAIKCQYSVGSSLRSWSSMSLESARTGMISFPKVSKHPHRSDSHDNRWSLVRMYTAYNRQSHHGGDAPVGALVHVPTVLLSLYFQKRGLGP